MANNDNENKSATYKAVFYAYLGFPFNYNYYNSNQLSKLF